MPFDTGFPFTAFLFKTPYLHANGYSDAIAVVAVQVLSVIDGKACCGVRTGGISAIEIHPVANLASTPEKALVKCAKHFSAMLSRPLLQNVAGKTEGTAEAVTINPATGKKTISSNAKNDAAGSAPQPLATPRKREVFSYANK